MPATRDAWRALFFTALCLSGQFLSNVTSKPAVVFELNNSHLSTLKGTDEAVHKPMKLVSCTGSNLFCAEHNGWRRWTFMYNNYLNAMDAIYKVESLSACATLKP